MAQSWGSACRWGGSGRAGFLEKGFPPVQMNQPSARAGQEESEDRTPSGGGRATGTAAGLREGPWLTGVWREMKKSKQRKSRWREESA